MKEKNLTEEKILIIDDEPEILSALSQILQEEGYLINTANCGYAGLKIINNINPDLVLLDIKMPGISGFETMQKIKEHDPNIIIFFMTAYSDVQDAVKAIKEGAYDYFSKPLHIKETKKKLKRALKEKKLKEDLLTLKKKYLRNSNFSNILTVSEKMIKIFHHLEKVAPTEISILITGESGTGKELIARAIHENSHRSNGPFIPIDCAAIPENLFESEIFGHEEGAFTSANRKKKGLFNMAHSGTLFLDEIGNLQPISQPKLLRAIQERKIKCVGGEKLIDVDVRVIAATNLDLHQAMEKCDFREELFYRINQFNIHLPPLRERKEDIILLANHFLEKTTEKNNLQPQSFSPEAVEMLLDYYWPGNIRELENVIHGSSVLAKDIIKPEHINLRTKNILFSKIHISIDLPVPLPLKKVIQTTVTQVEKKYLQNILLKTGYRKNETSKQLGIGLKTLYSKLNKYNLDLTSITPDKNKKETITFSAGMTLQEASSLVLWKLERWAIIKALRSTGGKKYLASKKLKIDYKTLWMKSNHYKIDNEAIYEEKIPEHFLNIDLCGELDLIKIRKSALATMEKELIKKTIEKTNGHKTEAAKMLNIDYKTLYNKMIQHNLFNLL